MCVFLCLNFNLKRKISHLKRNCFYLLIFMISSDCSQGVVVVKEAFLDYSINLILAKNNYDELKISKLRYGLEAFYMLFVKLSAIILLAIILGLFKEVLLFILIYTPLRGFGFGFHANSSLQCWLISVPVFIVIPFLSKVLTIPLIVVHAIILLSTVSYLLYAPADSKKKPLVNMKKRLINKSLMVIIGLIYLFATIFIQNHVVINSIMFSCLWQAICVNPKMYKLFHQPFQNYKNYNSSV